MFPKSILMRAVKILLALVVLPVLSFAWNGSGHSTGGAVAYYYLKANSPATITKIVTILKDHPWYNDPRWTDQLAGLSGERREIALFMLASTFPDDARDVPELGGGIKTKWHYVDYPFVPHGQTINAPQPQSPNAEEKIEELLRTIKTERNGAQKAMDICWIFHLIEDIHQPLHTACLFDASHPPPAGDRGGNSTFITLPGSSYPIKLHSYWDGLIKGTFNNIPAKAEQLFNNPMYSASKLTELKTGPTVHDWVYKESFELAKEKAYLNGAVDGTAKSPTAVPADYGSESTMIANRRIVLAGTRIGMKMVVALK